MRRFRFDRFELVERSGDLLDRGEPIHLQPKPFALLMLLLEHPGVLFSREALLEHLWPGVHVTEDSLSQAIARLRRALGDSQVLQTVQRRGYRLVAEVVVFGETAERPAPQHPSADSPSARALPREAALLGREAELEQLGRELRQRGESWVYGPPGVGRTALALAAAARSGLQTVSCSVKPEGGLLRAMQQALALSSSEELENQRLGVGQALGARGELLVVVDDAHLDPDALELLQRWQRMAPQVRWLVTSRERMGHGPSLSLGPLALAPAVRLLSERAGVELEAKDPGVTELVQRLDGLPLALVLAAPRLRLLSPGALLERLSGRFELLRDAGQSLSAALSSAWAALGTEQTWSLQRLAALGTELPIELAEALLGGDGALERLQALVDASWLAVRQQDGSSMVYLMHNQRAWIEAHADRAVQQDAVRQAGEWLEEHGVAFAERATQGERAAIRWFVRAADALDTAAMQCPPDRSPSTLVRMALGAHDLRGSRVEDLERLQRHALAHPALTPAERPGMQLRLGVVLIRRSPVDAIPALRLAVEQAEAQDDLLVRCWAWTELAAATAEVVRQDALPMAARADELAQQTGDLEYISYSRYMRCLVDRINGRPDLAAIEEALSLPLPAEHNTRILLLTLRALVLQERGRLVEAEALFRQLIPMTQGIRRAAQQGYLGHLLGHAGDLEQAEALCEEALLTARRMGQPRRTGLLQIQLSRIQIALGRLDLVEQTLAELLLTEMPLKMRGDARAMQALLAARQGRAELAVHWIEGALQDRPDDAGMMAMASILCARAGDLAQADLWLGRAVDLPDRWPNDLPVIELATAWLLWARASEDPQAMLLYQQQLQLLDTEPARGCAPHARRLMEMTWLRPDRQVA